MMSQSFSQIKIGLTTNLLDGLNSAWDPRNSKTNILLETKKQAIQPKEVEPVENRGNWSFPDITLHESAKTLLDELIPYKIISPSSEIDAPHIGSGALLVGMSNNHDALTELSKTIGVDLTNPNYRYALVKLNRLDGLDTHACAASGILVHVRPRNPDPAYNLTEDFKSDVIKLRHGGKVRSHDFDGVLNVKTATQAIESFADYGTHYVSSVQLGDTILQVFAYSQENFERLKLAYTDGQNPLSGPGSQDFAQFTTNSNTGAFGYVADYGNIISLSNSEIFQTTLRNGDWLDTLWSHKNSVFSLFNSKSKLSLVQLEQQFKAQTVMQVQLASMSVMMEQKRGLIWQRVFKAAMVQKYSTNIEANFAIYDNRDFNSLLPEDAPGLISSLATPTINVYKTRLDLSQMQFVAEEEVENFILFSNVLMLSGSNKVAIPGSQVKLFGQILDLRTDAQPKNIKISDRAFDSLEIGCSEFLGALMIQNESGTKHSVIVDGIKFALDDNNVNVIVDCDVRMVPAADSLPLLVNSIQYSMTFAEAVMSDQTGQQRTSVQQLIGNYLQWLATIIPATTVDKELLSLRIRALDLANYAVDPNYGSFVPILPAEEYDQYITSILDYLDRIQLQIAQNNQEIANRRLEELVINVAETLNQNIIDTGNLVSGIIDANVAQQKDMEGFYDALISQQEQEAQRQRIQINELKGLLFSAQGDVDFAVQQYKSAVETWQTITTIKFGLDVATNLFTLGTAIAIPASSIGAVEALGSTVQMIQKTLNVLNATSTLYTDAASDLKDIQGAQTALDDLQGISFGSPSTLAWDEMAVQFKQILATGPDVKQEKAALEAAFAILVLRGKAVTNAESSLHALERDIYTNQQQKQINTNQAARISELQDNLNPQEIQDLDKSAIDLVGLTGYLEFIQNQMLTILSKAFLQKDLALQYENLQPATLIPSFSLLKFSAAIVQQNAATITAKSLLAQYQQTTTNSLDFVISNVKPSELTNGAIRNTTIFLDTPLFYSYVDVRVVSVVVKIDGVESTETGKYLLKLAYDGTPFHDRNIERDALNFRTPWRERVYEYEVDGNRPTFSDDGRSWSDGVSRITPFSTWNISFPDTQTNKDIKFNKDLLNITLSFVLEARIIDAQTMMLQKATRRRMMFSTLPTAAMERQLASESPMEFVTSAPPSTPQLISQMYAQGSCTNGWDVVFNMGLEQINKALRDQYDTLQTDTTYKNTISVETSETYPGDVKVINKFTIDYGYPLLTFSVNNTNSATLNMEILSGSLQRCSQVGNGPLNCDPLEDISGETMTAIVDLAKVAGQTTVDGELHDVLKVQLDMSEGAFTISNIDLSDPTKVEFNKAVKAYFVSNPVIFLINELDLTNIPTLDALKPSNFLFKPYESALGTQMLQLFIMTGGRALLNFSQAFLNNIPEPLSLGQNSSMMISSKIMFKDVLPKSIQNNGWALEGVEPQAQNQAWSSRFTSASVPASVDLSSLFTSTTSGFGSSISSTSCRYSTENNPVDWSLVGTTLTAQDDGQVAYNGSQASALKYTEYCITSSSFGSTSREKELSTDISIESNATLSFGIGGSGREQTINISTSGQAINITGRLSGGGPSDSDNFEALLNQQIDAQIPDEIASKLVFDFEAISVFALKNLLFPSNNYINFESSALPGDMLIVGNFTS